MTTSRRGRVVTAVRPYGQDALLAEVADPHQVSSLLAAAAALDGAGEVVPGATTLLVRLSEGADRARMISQLSLLEPATLEPDRRPAIELAVVYDGADLAEVAGLTGLDPDRVVEVHLAATYTVRFCGFSPGWGYLDGLDERLQVPRRDEPRTAVPAGSVGIGGEFTGVYPRVSPGGWRLLGHSDAPLWDANRDPPALLTPGATVRFVRA